MTCYHPLTAWRLSSQSTLIFRPPRGGEDVVEQLHLPCGQCIGCRLERSRQWAIRCVHEASLHKQNAFITLTYSDDNLPDPPTLRVDHFQKFMRIGGDKYAS